MQFIPPQLCLLIKAILKMFLKTRLIDSDIDFAIYQGGGGSIFQRCMVHEFPPSARLSYYLPNLLPEKWKINLPVSDIEAQEHDQEVSDAENNNHYFYVSLSALAISSHRRRLAARDLEPHVRP